MLEKFLIVLMIFALVLVISVMPELLPLVDAVGIEAAATFVLYYLKNTIQILLFKLREFWVGVVDTFYVLTYSILFEPRSYLVHTTTTAVILMFTGSTLLAFAIWMPVFAMSGSAIG